MFNMATKTKEELLATYKKANKPARLVIIGKAGFTSEEEYFAYLDTLETVKKPKKGLASFFGKKEEKEESTGLDQVICFDTTGSMASYLAAVRKHIVDLIPKIFEKDPDVRMKIVAFGDYCDMESDKRFGKAYQTTQLTNNQKELIDFVKNALSTSGGDSDEFYELVIKKVVEETEWRPKAKKAVLLIADCEPHEVGYSYHNRVINNQINWKDEAAKSAKEGISWDTLTCGNDRAVKTFYEPLSKMTNGVSIPFKSSEKTQDIVYATTLSRGMKSSSRAGFMTAYAAATTTGDTELVGAYKSLATSDATLMNMVEEFDEKESKTKKE